MPVKCILVPMNAVQSDRGTLDLALALARPTSGHIRAAFVRPDPRDVAVYGGFGAEAFGIGRIMEDIEKEGAQYAARAHKAFEAWCAKNDVSEVDVAPKSRPKSDRVTAAWHDETGSPDQVIARLGGLADMIVETGLYDDTLPLEQSTIEASLFGAGQPVLAAPKAVPKDLFAGALIAWNGSREANRAVTAALELLARCKKVGIFYAPEHATPEADTAELVQFLGWHGITAELVNSAGTGHAIGADLIATATREAASLLVMGAYTHGRFREMVLGGVTHHVLHNATLPVFLAH